LQGRLRRLQGRLAPLTYWSNLEDVGEPADQTVSYPDNMDADVALVGNQLPYVGGVELASQPFVLVGEYSTVAGVDTVGAVACTSVFAGNVA